MMAFILATDFDFIAYMRKMAFFFLFFGGGGELFSRQWRFWNMIHIYWLNDKSFIRVVNGLMCASIDL